MSHRRPATTADKYIDQLLAKHPRLSGIDHVVYSFSEEAAQLRDMCDRPMSSSAEIAWRMANDHTMLIPDDVALWSRWADCRHVYRFDQSLSRELAETEIPRDMPTAPLELLPYQILYIESHTKTVDWQNGERELLGYFCWVDRGITEHAKTYDDWAKTLVVRFVYADSVAGNASINLELGTIGAAMDESIRMDKRQMTRYAIMGAAKTNVEAPDHEAATEAQYRHIINHLLYIIADNSDQEIVYKPAGNSKRKNTCRSIVHEVGRNVGRALGEARVRYAGNHNSGTTDTTKRPHIRAGHWHHYWTGPRNDPEKRTLIVRWVMPTFVNGGGDANTVIHDIKNPPPAQMRMGEKLEVATVWRRTQRPRQSSHWP